MKIKSVKKHNLNRKTKKIPISAAPYIIDDENDKLERSEKKYQNKIVKNWNKINQLKKYLFKCTEYKTNYGRIDILAYYPYTKQDVIIELKMDGKNPSMQLEYYSKHFKKQPILIGITEVQIPINKRQNGIIYYTFEELLGNKPYPKSLFEN